jgi:hypothetical protein
MIKVYHLKDRAFIEAQDCPEALMPPYMDIKMGMGDEGRQEAAAVKLFDKGLYSHVANVDTTNMDKAWELTNHISHSWLENEEVTSIGDRHRSSSVGDLFEDEKGVFNVISNIGFKVVNIKPLSTTDRPKP